MNAALLARRRQPRSRGLLLKAAIVVPDVIISSLIGLVIVAALPAAGGLSVIAVGVVIAALFAAGLGEDTAVRILYGARRPTPTEVARLGVPWRIVTTRVDTGGVQLGIVSHGPAVATAGRRHVLLARVVVDANRAGRITDGEVAALIAHGIGRLHHGRTRFDLLWVLWTWPWDFLRGLVVGIGRRLAWLPLVQFAWQTRFVVGTIAVVLEAQAGRWPSPIIIATFIASSYLMPRWARAWEQHLTDQADRFVTQVGLSSQLTLFLRRLPCQAHLADRIDRLTEARNAGATGAPARHSSGGSPDCRTVSSRSADRLWSSPSTFSDRATSAGTGRRTRALPSRPTSLSLIGDTTLLSSHDDIHRR